MSTETLLISGVMILITHYISTITGYGSTMMALPLLIWITGDLQMSVVTLLLIGTVQAYYMAACNYRDADWHEIKRVLVWVGLGTPLGILSMRYLPKSILLGILGVVLILAGLSRVNPDSKYAQHMLPQWALKTLLFVGGILHGAFVCGGATIAVYAQHALVQKDKTRATLFVLWVIMNTALIATTMLHGAITKQVMTLSLVGLPFVILSAWLGDKTSQRLSQNQFTRYASLILIVSGISMIIKAL